MSINAQNRPLPDWFTRVRTRQIALPRFQRFEAWDSSYVSQLFNTILQGLPVGALLTLEIGNEEPFQSRSIKGAPEKGERITEHLLDGQQRLTALWRGLHNNYDKRTYFICIEPDDETELPYHVKSIGRWMKVDDTQRRPFYADDPAKQWARKLIPLDLCAPDTPQDDVSSRYRTWAKEAIEDSEEREEVAELRSQIRNKFATFNLPFLNLPVDTPKGVALDVFIKMNTSAEPLQVYDIVVAQLDATIGQSLHDLVAEAKKTCPNIEHYYDVETLVLYASALLQGKLPTNKTYLDPAFGRALTENWDDLIEGIKRAAILLEEERIFDQKRLPSDVVVPVIAAILAKAPKAKDSEGRARSILRKYIWRAFFSNRYERSTNSRAPIDYNQINALVHDDQAETPIIFDDEETPLPQAEELINAGWPKKKDRLARAILAIALREGGHDLADGSTVSPSNLTKREYHHLFPVARLKEHGLEDRDIYRSLNCALVTWQTNRTIGAKHPEKYLTERSNKALGGDAEVAARLASHLIPFDELKSGDYSAFLAQRAKDVETRMLAVCGNG